MDDILFLEYFSKDTLCLGIYSNETNIANLFKLKRLIALSKTNRFHCRFVPQSFFSFIVHL